MKKTVLLLLSICLAISCDKYPDPSISTIEDYSFYFQTTTDNNKFLQGDWVGDSIIFRVVNNKSPLNDSVKVLFEVVEGGGNVTIQSAFTNEQGNVTVRWQLGTESFEQKLRAKTYDLTGKYLTSTDLIIYAFKNDGWDPYPSSPDAQMTGLVADTINKVTYMISGSTLYKQGDKYFIWSPVYDSKLNNPRTINIDGNGIIYISTWTGDLIISTDHGISWKYCTKPYPDLSGYIFVYVANDNFIWVYAFDHNTRYSKDDGITWTDIDPSSGITAQGFGNIFRLKDGSLLYHGGNCCSLNRSFDNGLTWTQIPTPSYSQKLFVDEKDVIYIVSDEAGEGIYRSADYGKTFEKIINYYSEWRTSMENTFTRWGNVYYILIPGFGIVKTADLSNPDSYEVYYRNTDIYNLFIDNNGVLIAKTLNTNIVFYHKASK